MADTSLLRHCPLVTTAAALRTSDLDLFDHIEQVCDRLDAVDEQIQAILPEADRRARLREDAAILLRTHPDPENRPPLFGVPVGVKDIFRVKGFPTQAGSQLPAELFEGEEAACVQLLRNAGALFLGKTVTTEFAYFEPGPTRNPHNPNHTPGGSSSGSAAAVAAGLCPLALGTQTIGSIIRPAAFCGVVGFKPSYGRIDPSGVIFIAPSLDHVGMFTQDVAGMRLIASLVCRDWRETNRSSSRIQEWGEDNVERLPTLGIPEGDYLRQASPEGLQQYEEQVSRLEHAGYTVKRVATLERISDLIWHHRALMAGEMAQVHRDWFARYEPLYRPRTAEMIRMGQQVTSDTLETARKLQIQLRTELDTQMQATGIDLWISPSAIGTAPKGLDSTGDPVMSFPWTFAGLPTVSLPTSTHEDSLPVGIQVIGRYMADELLLAWANAIADTLSK
jgi:Asp-tRNA(Asn)/Glu-tRNA(Gln) amidotransferase A subunit family amidase